MVLEKPVRSLENPEGPYDTPDAKNVVRDECVWGVGREEAELKPYFDTAAL